MGTTVAILTLSLLSSCGGELVSLRERLFIVRSPRDDAYVDEFITNADLLAQGLGFEEAAGGAVGRLMSTVPVRTYHSPSSGWRVVLGVRTTDLVKSVDCAMEGFGTTPDDVTELVSSWARWHATPPTPEDPYKKWLEEQ